MNGPRVLLVDDDASIRRFVELALEDLPIEFVACASVREAVAALQDRPAALLITDLMMPGETGLDLLEMLAASPALAGHARVAVFSAGLNAAMQSQLARFDIWRSLSKPISVMELEACVREACGDAVAPPPAQTTEASAAAGIEGVPAASLSPLERAAVSDHFAGELALFLTFRAACLQQFHADVAAGDAAVATGDAQALRRLAHSLKTVLATLGHPVLSARSAQLEELANAGDWPPARIAWRELSGAMRALPANRD